MGAGRAGGCVCPCWAEAEVPKAVTRPLSLNDKEKSILKDALLKLCSTDAGKLSAKIDRAFGDRSARYSKNKGGAFQLWMAGKIAELFDMEWDNQDDHSPIKTRSMGSNGNDLIMQNPLYDLFPYDVECKDVESLQVPIAIEQAKANTKAGRHWLVAWKNSQFDEPVVIISWTAFKSLWKRIIGT